MEGRAEILSELENSAVSGSAELLRKLSMEEDVDMGEGSNQSANTATRVSTSRVVKVSKKATGSAAAKGSFF